MIYPSIDKLLNVINSKYELVHIAANRSREMTNFSNYQMKEEQYRSSKNIGKALEEVAAGLIYVKK